MTATSTGVPRPTAETGAWEDILCPGLRVVFVGFNPSLPAWRTGHYYANPGNRFYSLLHEVGLTPHRLRPAEDRTLPRYGIGVTDLVAVPSARSDQVAAGAFRAGVPAARSKLLACAPSAICCNGVGVFTHLFGQPPVGLGRQFGVTLGESAVFVTLSTSGMCNGRSADRLAAFRDVAAFIADLPDPALPTGD